MVFHNGDLLLKLVIAIFASTGFWAFTTQAVARTSDRKDAHTKMLLGLAHDRLYYLSSTYIYRECITTDEFDNLRYLYEAYAALGGNGTGKKLFDEACKLPIVSAAEATHRQKERKQII